MPFSYQLQKNSTHDEATLYLAGLMDESVKLPEVTDLPEKRLIFDMKILQGISSAGIRYWSLWIEKAVAVKSIVYRNVPHFMMTQASIVQSLFPSGTQVHSFSLIYFCDDLQEARQHLFQKVLSPGSAMATFMIPRNVSVQRGDKIHVFELDHQPDRVLKCIAGLYQIYDFEKNPEFF